MHWYRITGDVESANPDVKKGATVQLKEKDARPLVNGKVAVRVDGPPAPKKAEESTPKKKARP